jgi:hypothetical protein
MIVQNYKAIISIDFDETIAIVNFPTIISVRELAKESINSLFDQGYFIIINTCRDNEHLESAINWLNEEQIKYHLINDNNEYLCHIFRGNCRKISADIYIDDKNIDVLIDPSKLEWVKLYENILKITQKDTFKSILQTF